MCLNITLEAKMSETQNTKLNVTDSKIKDITDFLKSSVLEPAEQEKETILTDAKSEASKIIANAKKEAEEIIANAKKEAETMKHNTESALKIAAKQSIDRLKLALEKEVLTATVATPVKDAMNSEALIKEFVSEFLKIYAGKGSFAIELPAALKEKLASYVKSQIDATGTKEIKLGDETLPSGFAVKASDGALRYDFTDESVTELLTEYIRPELRKALFSK